MRVLRFVLSAGLALLLPFQALAAQYEADIRIDDEQDLYELNARGAISDETLEELVDLLRTGVDLNNANRDDLYELPSLTYEQVDRILAYRKLATKIDDPADLVRNGLLTEDQLKQIAPFLVLRDPGAIIPVTGRLRSVTTYTAGDPLAPPSFLQVRLKAPLGFTAGLLATTTRQRVGPVLWDDSLQAMTATDPHYGFELPKFFVQWKGAQASVIAGTYRLGFGQRLVLDNTTRQTPDGIYLDDSVLRLQRIQASFCRISGGTGGDPTCTAEEQNLYVTPDFRWRTGFRGVAGTVHDLAAGPVNIDLTAFASYQSRGMYQYALYNPQSCDDPHNNNLSGCTAPPVQLRNADGSVATTRFTFQTLPSVFNEVATGANATVRFDPGKHVGLTGYFARPILDVPLDFQEYSPYPFGGSFGAVGLDGAYTLGHLNLFAEAARSFDSEKTGPGGGFGVVQRTVYSFLKQEFELAVRYYDRNYLNPYSRAISEPDRLDGQRVRNEAGALLRYSGKPIPDLFTRAEFDVWTLPGDASAKGTAGTSNLRVSARADYDGFDYFSPGLWVDYRNKGLGTDPNTEVICYSGSSSTDTNGDVLPCTGQFVRLIQRLELLPKSRYASVLLQTSEKWVDDPAYAPGMRLDASAFVQVSSAPVTSVRLRARVKYLDEAVDKPETGERSIWSFLEAGFIPSGGYLVSGRYDNYLFVDTRASTATRRPNPAHRFTLQLEAKF